MLKNVALFTLISLCSVASLQAMQQGGQNELNVQEQPQPPHGQNGLNVQGQPQGGGNQPNNRVRRRA